jgi:hypothetical protein
MPVAMRKLGLMSLFQWSAMSGYWLYVTYSIARTVYHTADAHSSAFHSAVLTNGEMAAFYNGISFVTAFAMVPLVRRIGPGPLHALCLMAGAWACWPCRTLPTRRCCSCRQWAWAWHGAASWAIPMPFSPIPSRPPAPGSTWAFST